MKSRIRRQIALVMRTEFGNWTSRSGPGVLRTCALLSGAGALLGAAVSPHSTYPICLAVFLGSVGILLGAAVRIEARGARARGRHGRCSLVALFFAGLFCLDVPWFILALCLMLGGIVLLAVTLALVAFTSRLVRSFR